MKDELLVRLESFEIDQPGARLPFSARLARDQGWDRGFARRVTGEYKRFLWLAMRAGHPVTPSREVDEAWHLHLCYTRSYWDDLCGKVLGKPLHHGPTEGGPAEDAKFADWYGRTLESYRHHFGEEPPADIWPPAARRFAPENRRTVDPREHWIVPKRAVRRATTLAAGLALVSLLVGCSQLLGVVDFGGFVCFAGLFLFLVVIVKIAVKGGKGGGGSGCGSSCGGGISFGGGGSDSSSGCGSHDGGSSGCGSSGCGGGGCGGGD
jgi:hypothetical protein